MYVEWVVLKPDDGLGPAEGEFLANEFEERSGRGVVVEVEAGAAFLPSGIAVADEYPHVQCKKAQA